MHLIWSTRPSIEDLGKEIIAMRNFEVRAGNAYEDDDHNNDGTSFLR